jgi:hypothetical protein
VYYLTNKDHDSISIYFIEPTVLHQDIGKKRKHVRHQKRTQQVVLKSVADLTPPETNIATKDGHSHSHSKFDFAGTNIPYILSPAEMEIIEAAMRQDPNLAPALDAIDDHNHLGDMLSKMSHHWDAEEAKKLTQKKAATQKKMSHSVSVCSSSCVQWHTLRHLPRTCWVFGSMLCSKPTQRTTLLPWSRSALPITAATCANLLTANTLAKTALVFDSLKRVFSASTSIARCIE